jgi:hypothetical protein
MAYEIPDFVLGTLPAGADLHTYVHRFVIADSSAAVQLATAAGNVLGVLNNKPVAGAAAEVIVDGVAKVYCDNTCTAGHEVQVGTGHGAINSTTGKSVGIALATGASGDVIPVLLKDIGQPTPPPPGP